MNGLKKYVIILIAFSVLFNNNYVGAADVVTERMKITSSSAEQTEGGSVASALGAKKDANSTKYLDVVELYYTGDHKVIWD